MKCYTSLLLLLPLIQATIPASEYQANSDTALKVLNEKWYDTKTGQWSKMWWQSGNIVTTIAHFGAIDSHYEPTAKSIIDTTYSQSGSEGWINGYYDDEGWWALAWIASYDLTHDPKYLNSAKNIFGDMIGGWTTNCTKGIWWDKSKSSITAIANELFLSVAAHLANRVPEDEKENYIGWAQEEWDWFSGTGIINSDGLINDGLDLKTCGSNGKEVFTYNQGVVLGGLAELADATGDDSYIASAKAIADSALNKMTENGILTEAKGHNDDTAGMFKGAFVRGLIRLQKQSSEQRYADFLKMNAESLLAKGKSNDGLFAMEWEGPSTGANAASHASGIDLLVAAAQV
ncbi:glycosyl hydrolase [Clohesyomyces aquaticus]|uniref:Glycosyl hydrolase n=1 Tax=Clohesyomyces aquaticus TaxID=1231657 RepID=A0A1Y1YQQ2_9PLEO|nr:glycosyl hydrolase [Clohesyomyces aquaticus]